MHDPDAEVKARARESLETLPAAVCDAVLSGETHPALLSYLAQAFRDDSAKLERIALNPATDDRTFVFLAGLPHKRVVEIVANNQARMLRCPDIVEALGENPLTGRSTIDRILSFLGIEKPAAEVTEDATERAARRPRGADGRRRGRGAPRRCSATMPAASRAT